MIRYVNKTAWWASQGQRSDCLRIADSTIAAVAHHDISARGPPEHVSVTLYITSLDAYTFHLSSSCLFSSFNFCAMTVCWTCRSISYCFRDLELGYDPQSPVIVNNGPLYARTPIIAARVHTSPPAAARISISGTSCANTPLVLASRYKLYYKLPRKIYFPSDTNGSSQQERPSACCDV